MLPIATTGGASRWCCCLFINAARESFLFDGLLTSGGGTNAITFLILKCHYFYFFLFSSIVINIFLIILHTSRRMTTLFWRWRWRTLCMPSRWHRRFVATATGASISSWGTTTVVTTSFIVRRCRTTWRTRIGTWCTTQKKVKMCKKKNNIRKKTHYNRNNKVQKKINNTNLELLYDELLL